MAQTEKVLAELKKNNGAIRADLGELNELVDRLIVPVIDFDAMSKLVLAKNWKQASADQRSAFSNAFKNLLKSTYTKTLQEYARQTIEYFPEKTRIKRNYATVYSEFVPGHGQPRIPVVYKLREKNGSWKAYNIEVNGLSFIKSYRTDFNSEIQAAGLDALIDRLEGSCEAKEHLVC